MMGFVDMKERDAEFKNLIRRAAVWPVLALLLIGRALIGEALAKLMADAPVT